MYRPVHEKGRSPERCPVCLALSGGLDWEHAQVQWNAVVMASAHLLSTTHFEQGFTGLQCPCALGHGPVRSVVAAAIAADARLSPGAFARIFVTVQGREFV